MSRPSFARALAVLLLLTAPAVALTTGATAVVPSERHRAEPAATVPVWLAPAAPHAENPTNLLAGRLWGVYRGPQDQVWRPYTRSKGATRSALATIAERPRTKWYAKYLPTHGSARP